ncbi:hypothetical protein ACLOAV_004877 [Pseudogymnoascus australis]
MSALDIILNTAIVAVNNNDHVRIYTQDTKGGVRESLYENEWQNDNGGNTIVTVKPGSPIAATSKELNDATSPPSSLATPLRPTPPTAAGTPATLAPKSSSWHLTPSAATFLAIESKLLHRHDLLQHLQPKYPATTPAPSAPLPPLRAAIAVALFPPSPSKIALRVYHSDADKTLIERAYDGDGWYAGAFVQKTIPESQAAVVE